MIELHGAAGYETVSTPNRSSTAVVQALLASGNTAPVVAEIGVGIGATTLAIAALLANRGELHIYDFHEKVAALAADLAALGFTNVKGFGNTDRHWDSYNWTLARMILDGAEAPYDYIYIDGAHTFAVDGLAFVLCDRLLKPGGYLEFDDYNWSFASSRWMRDSRDQFMTDEQIGTPQVKMVVDLFLHGNAHYEAVQPNRLFRKLTDAPAPGDESDVVDWRGQAFRVIRHPAVAAALAEFRSSFEAGTLQFFDAVLPACDRMIDVGAHVGLMSLYVASRVADVFAFEVSPTNFNLLARNLAVNDAVRDRIRLYRYGLGERDERVPLYRKANADSGASIFRLVERGDFISGQEEALVELRDARVVLREIGVTPRSLLKIDIEGAEYLVVPALADILAETRPYLHLSFHPFNLVTGDDAYCNAVTRIRRAMQIAEALAPYHYMYCFSPDRWYCVEPEDRMVFLREYLLRQKPVQRIASPQYGFIDAIGFSDVRLPALDAQAAQPATG